MPKLPECDRCLLDRQNNLEPLGQVAGNVVTIGLHLYGVGNV